MKIPILIIEHPFNPLGKVISPLIPVKAAEGGGGDDGRVRIIQTLPSIQCYVIASKQLFTRACALNFPLKKTAVVRKVSFLITLTC